MHEIAVFREKSSDLSNSMEITQSNSEVKNSSREQLSFHGLNASN